MDYLFILRHLKCFIIKEHVLQCYYCLSDDHNYGDCDSEHAGEQVTCQTENPDLEHYGHTCAVGHTGEFKINKLLILRIFVSILLMYNK